MAARPPRTETSMSERQSRTPVRGGARPSSTRDDDTGRRIVVTDMGVTTAAGDGVDAAWTRLLEGRSCIGPVQSFDARAYPDAVAAEVSELPRVGGATDERAIRLLLAASEGLSDELLDLLRRDRGAARRTAIVMGTSKGAVLAMAGVHRRFRAQESPLTADEISAIQAYRPGHGAQRLASHLGVRGPRSTVALACASSAMAIIQAADMLRFGVVDRAVAGGFDCLSPFIFAGFKSIGALSPTMCRPFDRRRDGTVLGEGAALVVLETAESAFQRGALPLAEYVGGGYAADGVHLTAPDRHGRGLARAIDQALWEGKLGADEVDYINAHGTATRFNDSMECRAFERVFGALEAMPPISSTKSVFGHTLGAAGALDAIVSILAIDNSYLPPTVESGVEPEVEGWDFVPERGRQLDNLDVVLTTNSGFAGNNTALVFRRYEPRDGSAEASRLGAPESEVVHVARRFRGRLDGDAPG